MSDKKELEIALTELMQSLIDAKDFVVSEAPDVIQQLMAFSIFECVFTMLFSFAVMWVSYKLVFVWSDQEPSYNDGWKEIKHIAAYVGGTASTVALTSVFFEALLLFKLLIAPKIFLIEKAASLF